ncbi:MAG TPA: hypothetical protein VMX77_02560 [Candidatus Bathyarchaeia archaeon]|nr:hypothetical protein [Candidatus Bathyarchaeia archaeon]
MKKPLPIIIAIIVFLVFIGGFFWYLKGRGSGGTALPTPTPEGKLIETALEERPYVTLTPSQDGHWLTLKIERIRHGDSLEYELIYNTASGVPQGSTNAVELKGEDSYTKKILLGTESRGNYRYDEGVTQGTLTLRFRSDEGVRKFITEFYLHQGEEELTSVDNRFSLNGQPQSSDFYLVMSTVGLPGDFEEEVVAGPYEVFSSATKPIKNAQVTLALEETGEASLYSWGGKDWILMEGTQKKTSALTAPLDELTTVIAGTVSISE